MAHHHPILDATAFDKTQFTIRIRTTRELRRDPEAFARNTELPIRSIKPHTRGGFSLDLLTYGGIKLKVSPPAADGLSDVVVHFNPGKVLYGHNGRVITFEEFVDALSIYINHARHLLEDTDDWIDLVPGIRAGGPGRWKLLEFPTHCKDPDGFILAALQHARHPNIRKLARLWPTSIELGSKRSNLQFSVYLKAIEMFNHRKLPAELLPVYGDILRLEARIRGKKLLHYLGNDDTVEVIDGKPQLVRLFPETIANARRTVFSELENVWHSDDIEAVGEQLGPLGILIAQVASDPRVSQTFPDLLRQLAFYSGIGSKRDTLRKIRAAGAGEMARRSTLSFDSIFSDSALSVQPSIIIPGIERKVSHRLEDIRRHPLLEAAYLPPGYVSSLRDPFPQYCR